MAFSINLDFFTHYAPLDKGVQDWFGILGIPCDPLICTITVNHPPQQEAPHATKEGIQQEDNI